MENEFLMIRSFSASHRQARHIMSSICEQLVWFAKIKHSSEGFILYKPDEHQQMIFFVKYFFIPILKWLKAKVSFKLEFQKCRK